MEISFNPGLKKAFAILEDAGFECYLVGGAVRDHLLGEACSDFDLATNASLADLMNLFSGYHAKLYSRGETISATVLGIYLEITPYKGGNILEDLSKRDFTVNAMAYSPVRGLVDPYNGEGDTLNGILRVIQLNKSLIDDPLRILRGIRIAATRDFRVEDKTLEEMNRLAYLLNDVKPERIKPEIDPVLVTEIPSKWIRAFLEVFFEIFKPLRACYKFDQRNRKWHHLDVLEHILKVVDSTKNNLVLRYAALLHDIKKPECFTLDGNGIGHFYGHERKSAEYAYEILTRLEYKGIFVSRVCRLIYFHDYMISNKESSILKFLYRFGTEDLDLLFGLKRADILGQSPKLIDRIYEIDNLTEHIREILRANKLVSFKNLKINGNILLEIGYEPTMIGRALRIILEAVQKKQLKNVPDELYEYARRLRYDLLASND